MTIYNVDGGNPVITLNGILLPACQTPGKAWFGYRSEGHGARKLPTTRKVALSAPIPVSLRSGRRHPLPCAGWMSGGW